MYFGFLVQGVVTTPIGAFSSPANMARRIEAQNAGPCPHDWRSTLYGLRRRRSLVRPRSHSKAASDGEDRRTIPTLSLLVLLRWSFYKNNGPIARLGFLADWQTGSKATLKDLPMV